MKEADSGSTPYVVACAWIYVPESDTHLFFFFGCATPIFPCAILFQLIRPNHDSWHFLYHILAIWQTAFGVSMAGRGFCVKWQQENSSKFHVFCCCSVLCKFSIYEMQVYTRYDIYVDLSIVLISDIGMASLENVRPISGWDNPTSRGHRPSVLEYTFSKRFTCRNGTWSVRYQLGFHISRTKFTHTMPGKKLQLFDAMSYDDACRCEYWTWCIGNCNFTKIHFVCVHRMDVWWMHNNANNT